MTAKRFDFRLAVGSKNDLRSSEWRVWSRKSDLYLSHRHMGMITKYSFHPPNICRSALTKEFIEKAGRKDRNAVQWLRDPTQEKGKKKVVRVLRIGFPTDFLSKGITQDPTHKNCHWIEPAQAGGTTFIDVMFTYEDEAFLQEALATEPSETKHRLITFRRLANGEAFAITSFKSASGHEPIRVKAASHDMTDIIALQSDPADTGRPIRFSYHGHVEDGHFLLIWELGCYRVPPLTDTEWENKSKPYRTLPAGALARNGTPLRGTHNR